jgi:hypothetical protein
MWKDISVFLEKFKNLKPSNELLKEDLVKIIKTKTNIEVSKDEIDVRNYVGFIKAQPIIKNEILLHKKEILDQTKQTFSLRNIKDIR